MRELNVEWVAVDTTKFAFHKRNRDHPNLDAGAWPQQPAKRPVLRHPRIEPARVMIFAGGIPIKTNGQIVGAVGVSGGGEQDQAVAEAAVAAWS
jgi:uncharacterized protein GlcG (DUF336 family)